MLTYSHTGPLDQCIIPVSLPRHTTDHSAALHILRQAALDGKGLCMPPKVPVERRQGHHQVECGGREKGDGFSRGPWPSARVALAREEGWGLLSPTAQYLSSVLISS